MSSFFSHAKRPTDAVPEQDDEDTTTPSEAVEAPEAPETAPEAPETAPKPKAKRGRATGVRTAPKPGASAAPKPARGAGGGADPLAPQAAPTPAAPSAPRPAGDLADGPYPGVTFRIDPDAPEPRTTDPGIRVSASFKRMVQRAHLAWSNEHFDELPHDPTLGAFQEALMRLGLKHLDDPEFASLIPPDARRR